jgi:hypothetical protein
MEHEPVVGRSPHVELDTVRPERSRLHEGGDGVLAGDGGSAAVGDDRGHDGDDPRSVDALGASEKPMQSRVQSELLANPQGSP